MLIGIDIGAKPLVGSKGYWKSKSNLLKKLEIGTRILMGARRGIRE